MTVLLALETTDKTGSIALCEWASRGGERLVAAVDLPSEVRSARSLVPAVRDLLRRAGVLPNDVGVVAVTIGPGSFTGLRVGLTAAKLFAYATGARLIGVDTLLTIAAAVDPQAVPLRRISAAVDAQRGEAIVRTFKIPPDGSAPRPLDEKRRLPFAEWWRDAAEKRAVLASPLLGVERVRERIPADLSVIDAAFWYPKAWAAGRIAFEQLRSGEFDDPWTLLPDYSRPAAAEEKLGAT